MLTPNERKSSLVITHSFFLLMITVTDWTFDETRGSPFQMEFDAIVTMETTVPRAPNAQAVFTIMSATPDDYENYIQNFVWNTNQMDPFYDVEAVTFTASVMAAARSGGRRRR